jgi:hypothetical protein
MIQCICGKARSKETTKESQIEDSGYKNVVSNGFVWLRIETSGRLL